MKKDQSSSPVLEKMRRKILGNSPALLNTLHELAKAVCRTDLSILIVGEPGTGKELFAQAIHQFGENADRPWVAVNVGAVSPTLIESELFGAEKGAFTGATERRTGFLEQASNGTLFLDEIGELDYSLQRKLLRVLQEKQFWRVGGTSPQVFKARVVFATNRELAKDVNEGVFRRDLYDRITELQIHVPSLRERQGDVDLLAEHFLKLYSDERSLRWMPDTLSILRSYSFPGNVRELQNLVKGAVLACDEHSIRPRHLPLERMAAFIESDQSALPEGNSDLAVTILSKLVKELNVLMQPNWLDLSYRDAFQSYEQAFDRVYLSHLLQRHHHNITRAATAAGIDAKTFRKRWRDCGLPPLTGAGDAIDG
ncbi:MAG: sigma 54-interacting transcriptional regulator [Pyrinomonadaceae bacterium]